MNFAVSTRCANIGAFHPRRVTAPRIWRFFTRGSRPTNPLGDPQRDARAAAVRPSGAPDGNPIEARKVVEAYYDSYNRRDIPALLELFDRDVQYHDLAVYDQPFVGIDELKAYFRKIENLVPADIRFVVDDITSNDTDAVGVMWCVLSRCYSPPPPHALAHSRVVFDRSLSRHVELLSDVEGFVTLPFSRGASFYKLKDGKIVYARDLVEPANKPGPAALGAISAIAPVIRKLGSKADPRNLSTPDGKSLITASALYVFAAMYVLLILFSDALPGDPGIRVDPSDLQRILHESYNFFYVNMALSEWGLSPVPNVAEHPVDEGLFNLVSAWSLTFLPLMVQDPKGNTIGFTSKRNQHIGVMFLTNFFMPWYMSRRLVPDPYTSGGDREVDEAPASLKPGGIGCKAIAATSLFVGAFSLYWIVLGRPEYSLTNRLEFFVQSATTNRVFWAFLLDAVLYTVWQSWLLKDMGAPTWQQRLPLFGTVAFLLGLGVPSDDDTENSHFKTDH